MKRLLSALLLFISAYGFATHNRAGEIIYTRVAPFTEVVGGEIIQVYTYSITLIKYTADGPVIADRCADTLYFGDGQRAIVDRINGLASGCGCSSPDHCGEIIISDGNYVVKKNIYRIRGTGVHRYPGSGSFMIRNFDPNRNANVANIPNSVDQPFYVQSLLVINVLTGANSSPQFHFDPIDRACLQKCFTHNPGAYDPDGDSLSYMLTECRGTNGDVIPGYTYPSPGSGGTFAINPTKGLLTWCSPQNVAEYNIAFIVTEWRKNTSGHFEIIGSVTRDMQVVVESCANNSPPQIIVPADTCVEAGAYIHRKIVVIDPNAGDYVTLDGEAGAFAGPVPQAVLTNTSGNASSAAPNIAFSADFTWQTTCDHIRQQPYEMVFKAKDHPSNVSNALATFNSYNIRVIPPNIKNVMVVPVGSNIKISWSLSSCNPSDNPLTNYQVYRKNDCTPFIPSPCQTGVPTSSGFALIKQVGAATYSCTDDNNGQGLVVGQDYSYLVVATYSDGTQTYASSQVCAKLRRDVPLLLNVDVRSTSETAGSVYLRWIRPLPTAGNLDTVALPGPYKFNLKYRPAGSSAAYTTIFSSPQRQYFLQLVDTDYLQTTINTVLTSYNYLVEFIAGSDTVGTSQVASSVFLNTIPDDRKIHLQWLSATPWNNNKYVIWRKDPLATAFSKIDSVFTTTYQDTAHINYLDTTHVVNGQTYCYKILSQGEYSDPSIIKPLLNYSEESCATAKDLTPPCTPTLTVDADCPTGQVRVSWTDIKRLTCGDDVGSYTLYYKQTIDEPYQVIYTGLLTAYVYDGLTLISGCYAVKATDVNNNVSPASTDFCIDNCPIFELPNVFSPNKDSVNDFFQAIKDRVRQIKEIDMHVYDRWGNLVYTTKDPYFHWDGVSIISKQEISAGTLFYICDVYEPRLKGIVKRTLKGYVELVR